MTSCVTTLIRPETKGTILDFNGNPISNCRVGETITDKSGSFTLSQIVNRGIIDDSNEKLRVEYVSGVKKGFFERNKELKSIWGEQYIDLIELISDSTEKVLIFTPDSKFISYDTYHFTKFGAIYYAHILEDKLLNVMNIN